MSEPLLVALLALAVSLAPVIVLALRDPKRLRASRGDRERALGVNTRRLLAAASLLPGVLLMLSANWHGFLIWMGALPCLGWALVWLLAPGIQASADTTRTA